MLVQHRGRLDVEQRGRMRIYRGRCDCGWLSNGYSTKAITDRERNHAATMAAREIRRHEEQHSDR